MKPMKNVLTTYEAAQKLHCTTGYMRRLMSEGRINGRLARISSSREMYLIDAASLRAYMKNRPAPGRPKK